MSNHQDINISFSPSNWIFSKLKCKQDCIYCSKYLICTPTPTRFGIKIYCSENPGFRMFKCKYQKRVKRKSFLIQGQHRYGLKYIRKIKENKEWKKEQRNNHFCIT